MAYYSSNFYEGDSVRVLIMVVLMILVQFHPKLITPPTNIPYNTNYFSSNTQYTISYSTSTELDDIEFEEYDPTPYGGGYDPTLTYGKPLPPSDEICYPRSLPEPNGLSSDNLSYASIPSPYGSVDIDEQSAQPPKKTKPTEEQPQPNGGTGDDGHDTGHPEKLPDSTLGECYPWSGYAYGVRNEDYVPQAPCGYGLDGMDMCESIFGYWPCLDRINRKNCGHQGVEVGQENQWEGAVEYLFGSPTDMVGMKMVIMGYPYVFMKGIIRNINIIDKW